MERGRRRTLCASQGRDFVLFLCVCLLAVCAIRHGRICAFYPVSVGNHKSGYSPDFSYIILGHEARARLVSNGDSNQLRSRALFIQTLLFLPLLSSVPKSAPQHTQGLLGGSKEKDSFPKFSNSKGPKGLTIISSNLWPLLSISWFSPAQIFHQHAGPARVNLLSYLFENLGRKKSLVVPKKMDHWQNELEMVVTHL